ncbi:hypothetical protein [Ruegeria lacuscaerulensis]|uniref:hypothetical protein n=1 Tax=Ruegeria lacuscaerulensis TaxID=55218 RepID=UPI00147E21B8|nr:hypothetical protein [Ruegeria lacuscaerulensis]
MTGSKFLLAATVISTVFLAACSAPGVYPVSGQSVSATDPVKDMDSPIYMYSGELR